ncbi:MAG: hypothetical protein CMJ34_09315 [Phycisphaerae bacterium]|nr:hypothetical protein [Phycisphaerae bacterium]
MNSVSGIIRHGVDFSGATSGGSGIRIATRRPDQPVQELQCVDRGDLRRQILAGLRDESNERHLWLIDAPFGIPIATLEACGVDVNWSSSLEWLASFPNPREWRRGVRRIIRKEPKRWTDRASATPLASMNLRVFKQTWTVMVEILAPLIAEGVRVEPMAGPRDSKVVVVEGCPASVLKRGGDPARGYKGRTDANRERRERILDRAVDEWGLRVSDPIADRCIADAGGDDLDALLLTLDPWQGPPVAEAIVEGWVW